MKERDFVFRDDAWKARRTAMVRASNPCVGAFMQVMWWQNETWAEVVHVYIHGTPEDRVSIITMDGHRAFLLWKFKPVVMPRPPRDTVFLSFLDSQGRFMRYKREFPSHFYRRSAQTPLPSPYDRWVDHQIRETMKS